MMRILLIEDDPTIAQTLQDDLQLEGYAVDVVRDGSEAEKYPFRNPYDMILLDIMLPGKDGFALCRSWRSSGLKTPLIILSARDQEPDKLLGLDLGADDYVTKPFSRQELLARIRALLRRCSELAVSEDVYKGDNIQIDFHSFKCTRGGLPVGLTATEFKILHALFQRRGEVLSIDKLMEMVWGRDVFLTDRVIYTHINNLRSKIEEDSRNPSLIVSIRGIGYRFDG
jgi:DNA-binding response OmpR family regulator